MTTKIHIEGIKQTKIFLNKKKGNVGKQITVGLNKAAMFMQGEVKESIAGRKDEPTSVDTGRFLNSVDFSVGKAEAVVFSQIPYAKHLEFGTSRIGARRHFQNSKSRNKNKIRNILNTQIKNI